LTDSARDRRILFLALVAVLALRLLAWTGGETGLVHAGQTIPTRTPTGQPVTPATPVPSRTPVPAEPTAPAPATASPAPTTPVPSATLPGASPAPPTPTLAPGGGPATVAPGPTGASPLPPTPSVAAEESDTAGPGEATAPPPAPTGTHRPPGPSPTAAPLPTTLPVGEQAEGGAAGGSQAQAGALSAVLLSPCLWVGLGLLLLAAGAALLLGRRRAL
jgi:hypothetical protein